MVIVENNILRNRYAFFCYPIRVAALDIFLIERQGARTQRRKEELKISTLRLRALVLFVHHSPLTTR